MLIESFTALRGIVNQLLRSYLTNRKQFVNISNFKSNIYWILMLESHKEATLGQYIDNDNDNIYCKKIIQIIPLQAH